MINTPQDWEKEFWTADVAQYVLPIGRSIITEKIRSLISQKEQELREEMKKMVEGMRERYVVDCMNGKIKKVVPYDKACSDILSRLEKEDTTA